MSFSSDVKEELSEKMGAARHCRIAETAAVISLSGRVRMPDVSHGFSVRTENQSVAGKICSLLEMTFDITPRVSVRQGSGNHSNHTYTVEIEDDKDTQRVLQSCKLEPVYSAAGTDLFLTQNVVIQTTCCKRAFLRGAFLAAGSISDPERSYHFEISAPSDAKARQVGDLMRAFDLEPHVVTRKKHRVVYLKEGDQIVDILNVMEATRSLMELENIRILKEMRGSVNRQVNCETANINKTVSASVEQTGDIEYIRDTIGFENLPENLREMAELRLENPEATLKELGEALDPPIGKSGVNHRLRRLCAIARELREST